MFQISVSMLTVVSPLVEHHLMDTLGGRPLRGTRAWSCRTAKGGSHSSTSQAASMTWAAPGKGS